MKNSYEQRVQNQFGGFCTRVLKNEANRILNEYARERDREKSLDELSPDELAQAASYDKYFQDEYVFEVLGQKVFVVGDLLAEALSQLPEDKRDVILLSYFLGMTDREISEQLNVVRQAISKAVSSKNCVSIWKRRDLNGPKHKRAHTAASDPGSLRG